jgi:dihydrodipicolinate synthase/N-acetylneuraminate lyase
MAPPIPLRVLDSVRRGAAIPALPLALTAARRFDERRQRALCRYYIAAGAGGIAAGVHTTQFAIREPRFGLYQPVLALVAEEIDRAAASRPVPLARIGGICGPTGQAVAEAGILRDLGYHAGLISLSGAGADDDARLAHCLAVAEVIPLVGFYLQRSVGGPDLSYRFWRRFAEIDGVIAIKIAPFDRYRTLDVVRAVAEAGRDEIALYTGNDDNIVLDLLTPYRFTVGARQVERRIVGGLLGHWAVWTRRAVELLAACHDATRQAEAIPANLLRLAIATTDANAALFDVANNFAGCIAGIHEVLRRQGLLEGIWCLSPDEALSPGQALAIDRIYHLYPELNDDDFVAQHRDDWLRH